MKRRNYSNDRIYRIIGGMHCLRSGSAFICGSAKAIQARTLPPCSKETVMDEKITLYGGPRDGHVLEWRGGDFVEFSILPPVLDFSVPTTDPVRHNTAMYVRSRRSPHIFVFQP